MLTGADSCAMYVIPSPFNQLYIVLQRRNCNVVYLQSMAFHPISPANRFLSEMAHETRGKYCPARSDFCPDRAQ